MISDLSFRLPSEGETEAPIASTDGIDRFEKDETLDELVAAINRDIQADKPAAALGHLHTYCAKKFGHLLDKRGIAWTREEPLNSRVGKYRKALEEEMPSHDMTRTIVRNSISIFEKFNDVRNNWSLAHDNPLLRQAEARFVFDSVVALLRFVKAIEAGRFEN
ncbi:abortive infection family protein [Aurantimonas sp. A2-1-M11]|uniref:abortive infection family protein n=1 Tax=Aurantimonas sp. A2-1-M11 TaxID=3113712 RepID=UPI002F937939